MGYMMDNLPRYVIGDVLRYVMDGWGDGWVMCSDTRWIMCLNMQWIHAMDDTPRNTMDNGPGCTTYGG